MEEMKQAIVITLAIVCMSSCGSKHTEVMRPYCNCEQREMIADWMTDNIGQANNFSDEEMEDVVDELRSTGVTLFCSQKLTKVNFEGYPVEKLDSSEIWINEIPN